ncbi:ATP-binding cassette domain-containing protein, partial [Streptomyces sp. S6]
GRLELRGVRALRDDRTVLDGVDLVVPGGTTLAVVGRSGSGKSLLAALAARLADPAEGEILLDGVPLRSLSPTELRSAITCAFDRPVLLGTTIQDTIMLGTASTGGEGLLRPPVAEEGMPARCGGPADGPTAPSGAGVPSGPGTPAAEGASAEEGVPSCCGAPTPRQNTPVSGQEASAEKGVTPHRTAPASEQRAPSRPEAPAEEEASAEKGVPPSCCGTPTPRQNTPVSGQEASAERRVTPHREAAASGQRVPSRRGAVSLDAAPSRERASLRQVAEAAARKAQAHPFVTRLPHGYDTPCADAPHSGGEAQRLGLARAFARPARLLVLDDALSSLDTITEHHLTDALFSPSTPTTRLLITHRATTAARADAVAWVEEGRIRAVGTHAELWKVAGYRGLFGEEGAADDEGARAGGGSRARTRTRAEAVRTAGSARGGAGSDGRPGSVAAMDTRVEAVGREPEGARPARDTGGRVGGAREKSRAAEELRSGEPGGPGGDRKGLR